MIANTWQFCAELQERISAQKHTCNLSSAHNFTALCLPILLPQALIFYKSVKAGFLLGVEQGSGFVIARWAWQAIRFVLCQVAS